MSIPQLSSAFRVQAEIHPFFPAVFAAIVVCETNSPFKKSFLGDSRVHPGIWCSALNEFPKCPLSLSENGYSSF